MAKTEQYDQDSLRRLGELLEARRGELGYESRPAFEKSTGLNVRLAADMEKGYRGNFKPDTIGRAAAAYQVTPASIMAVLRGHADALIPADPVPPASRGERPPWITAEEERGLRPWADDIWERLVHLGEDATGAQLFGEGTADAADWDELKRSRARWSLREMVTIMAGILRRADADEKGNPTASAG